MKDEISFNDDEWTKKMKTLKNVVQITATEFSYCYSKWRSRKLI